MESDPPTDCRECCVQSAIPTYLSPGLVHGSNTSQRAIELKFLLPIHLAKQLKARARGELQFDPFADQVSGQYKVCSLYLDTRSYDIYHRTPATGGAKFRFRRYDDGRELFLERKLRQQGVVSKLRDPIPLDQLLQLSSLDSAIWSETQTFGLLPSCAVEYRREAFISEHSDVPFRVTIDNELSVHRFAQQGWSEFQDYLSGTHEAQLSSASRSLQPLEPNHCVVEFKFMDSLPVHLKRWVEDFQIAPIKFSKYRAAMKEFITSMEKSVGATL